MEEDKRILEKLKKKEKIYKIVIVVEIVITLIALALTGLILYRNNDDCSMYSELEINSFNGRFYEYEGKKVPWVKVRALIQAVNANNNTAGAEDEEKQILLEGENKVANISTGESYKIEITEYSEHGFIKRIKITKNSE